MNRREQESRDRAMAMQLSTQNTSPYNTPTVQDTNAFDRIMHTQQLNSMHHEPQDDGSSPSDGLPDVEHLLNPQWATPQMPGSYNSSWDSPSGSSSTYYQTPTYGVPQPPMPAPGSQNFMPGYAHGNIARFSGPTIPGPSAWGHNQYQTGAPMPPSYVPHFQSSAEEARRQAYNRNFPQLADEARDLVYGRSNGDSLSNVISRANNYDFVNGVDHSGQQLPERMTNFLKDAWHDPRVSEDELEQLLQNIRPDMDIPEKNRDGTPAGLKGTLYYHQELALTWLKKMEEGTNKGGILADDMGLGKTISMISLMITRKATARPKVSSHLN